ncbi:MAG: TolC family protein [Gemmatimonadota bacterium]|nr:TolC family protein [Gemmatimonadota bacterium]
MTLLLLLGLSAHPAAGQELRSLTLAEAVAEARENNPNVAITQARAVGAREQVTVMGASRWPSLGLEAGVVTSNDPVAAFGGRLRQGRFTEADFDPAALNGPDALTDLNAAVALSWAPIDFSRDAALDAARAGAEAARLGSEWARTVAGYQAEVRYLEAASAELLLESANAALEAAEENLRLVEERAGEGAATEADVLQARAALEDARARGIKAEQGVADARGRLGLALGWPVDVVPVPASASTTLSADAPVGSTSSARADLAASEAQVEAASATVSRASRARLPRLEGFARVEAHSDEAFDAHGDSWTVGLRVSVPLFTGFELGARKEAARAELTAATLEHDRLVDEARTTLSEARRGAESRRRAALAAEASAEAAEEAARLLRLRYDEGLATTAELLAAEAAALRFTNAAVQARLAHRVARARLLLLDDPRLDHSSEGANR